LFVLLLLAIVLSVLLLLAIVLSVLLLLAIVLSVLPRFTLKTGDEPMEFLAVPAPLVTHLVIP
jgi:hypothetical protein